MRWRRISRRGWLKLAERHIILAFALLLNAIFKLWRQGEQWLNRAIVNQIIHRREAERITSIYWRSWLYRRRSLLLPIALILLFGKRLTQFGLLQSSLIILVILRVLLAITLVLLFGKRLTQRRFLQSFIVLI
ncbi:hypothetical protein D3C80_668620 [compost metagenome]